MAWFKKKQSPIEKRLGELDQEIAALQEQLRRQREEEIQRAQQQVTAPQSESRKQPSSTSPNPQGGPRFRTTVRPGSVSPVHGIEPHEVDFFARKDRPVDFSLDAGAPAAQKPAPAPAPAEESTKLPSQVVQKVIALFARSKPQPQQERLASFLTTGSFQRLKPLRYEKRVARNRLIILAVILLVVAFLLVKCVTR